LHIVVLLEKALKPMLKSAWLPEGFCLRMNLNFGSRELGKKTFFSIERLQKFRSGFRFTPQRSELDAL
jgi:hypothetical protein